MVGCPHCFGSEKILEAGQDRRKPLSSWCPGVGGREEDSKKIKPGHVLSDLLFPTRSHFPVVHAATTDEIRVPMTQSQSNSPVSEH